MISIVNPASLNKPAGTVLKEMRGPLSSANPIPGLRRNKTEATNNAAYVLRVRGAGAVRIEGTNDVRKYGDSGDLNIWTLDVQPKPDAVWTPIVTQTGEGETTFTSADDYAIIRTVIVTQGDGLCMESSATWD